MGGYRLSNFYGNYKVETTDLVGGIWSLAVKPFPYNGSEVLNVLVSGNEIRGAIYSVGNTPLTSFYGSSNTVGKYAILQADKMDDATLSHLNEVDRTIVNMKGGLSTFIHYMNVKRMGDGFESLYESFNRDTTTVGGIFDKLNGFIPVKPIVFMERVYKVEAITDLTLSDGSDNSFDLIKLEVSWIFLGKRMDESKCVKITKWKSINLSSLITVLRQYLISDIKDGSFMWNVINRIKSPLSYHVSKDIVWLNDFVHKNGKES